MSRPTITVAIPSYNKETQIERCINSVLQNALDIDCIILVDNASTDTTFNIAQQYAQKINCYRNETNLGMSGNFNRCIELCDTDWLMIFHADDVMLPGAIAKYRSLIKKYPDLGLIHADAFSTREGDESTKKHYPRMTREYYTAGKDAMSCPYGICSAVMVLHDAYKKWGGFINSSLSSDAEMWARVAAHYPVGSLNEPTAIYYLNTASTGPQSLINRSIREIQADWENLNAQTALLYPEGPERVAYLENVRLSAPGNYFAVVKENIRARHWRNVYDALWLIIFEYNGFVSLIKISTMTLLRQIIKRFKS